MGKIIAVTNQKGGVGKTTTAQVLAVGLKNKGKRVLVIDTDGQGTLTSVMGARPEPTILDVINGDATIESAIQTTAQTDIIPANIGLYNAGDKITGIEALKDVVEPIKGKYDYILIDTPPAVSVITVNALMVCDYVLITALADMPTVEGIIQLATATIPPVKEYNSDLKIAGILLVKYNNRTTLNRNIAEYLESVAKQLGTRLYKSTIREAVAVREAQTKKTDIFSYAPRSKVAEDYKEFINEFVRSVK